MDRLPFITIFALFLLLAPQALASTTIDVSGNGDGSHTSVSVHSNTGSNYVNGQKVSGSNGSSTTKVTVNGKTYVDETTDGSHETNISVKAEGNKEPEVKYEVKKSETATTDTEKTKDEAKVLSDQVKKEVAAEKAAQAEKLKASLAKQAAEHASLFARIEAFFDGLRSFFSRK
jgi:hypothetical protein